MTIFEYYHICRLKYVYTGMMKNKRLDLLLVEKKFAESRNHAQNMIMAGEVLVDGQLAYKSSQQFTENSKIELKSKPRFVSRGGLKLEAALYAFDLTDLSSKVCVDIGASTGGFTDCLLQHGALKVFAIDVGYGQMHSSIRAHSKVVVMERTNIREIATLPDDIDIVTVDVSFISLKLIFPVIAQWSKESKMDIVALIKPQFEAGKKIAAKGKGVIRDEKIRKSIKAEIIDFAVKKGFEYIQSIDSPITGPKGNKEILVHFRF